MNRIDHYKSPGLSVSIWDVFVLVLIVFPLVTGGLWVRRPGLFIELSELGIPVILCSALGAYLHWQFGARLEKGYAVTLAQDVFERWKGTLSSRPLMSLWVGAILNGAVWSLASLRRHWNLESSSYDLGLFTNAIWNLTHGGGYVSSIKGGIPLFSDHQSPFFFLLAPLFWLVPRPETLLVVQGFGLAAGGVALYFLGEALLEKKRGVVSGFLAALPLLYWAYLPLRNSNAFDFHPEVFMLPVFLWSLSESYRPETRRKLWGLALLLLALTTKESAGPVAVGLGLAWLLGGFRKQGLLVCLLGVVVFIFDVKGVPHFFATKYAYEKNYEHLGHGLREIFLSPILKPQEFFSAVFNPSALKFYFFTLAPLGFLPFLGWQGMIAALPGYLMPVLSGAQRTTIQFHYTTELSVGLFFALVLAFQKMERSKRLNRSRLALWIVFWSIACFGRSELYRIRIHEPTKDRLWTANALTCLSPNAFIAATDALVPQISTRQWIQRLPDGITGGARPLDCVVIDSNLGHWPMSDSEVATLPHQLKEQEYESIFHCKGLEIFEADSSQGRCLRCKPQCE